LSWASGRVGREAGVETVGGETYYWHPEEPGVFPPAASHVALHCASELTCVAAKQPIAQLGFWQLLEVPVQQCPEITQLDSHELWTRACTRFETENMTPREPRRVRWNRIAILDAGVRQGVRLAFL